MKTLKEFINEAKSLPKMYKKDIDSYINGMDKSDLKTRLDQWENGERYDNLMFNLAMNLFGSDYSHNPKYKVYKQLVSDYAYFKIKNRLS